MTWVKGQSGNPAGAPRRKLAFSAASRELLESNNIDITWEVNGKRKSLHLKSNKNMAHGLAAALITEGLKGNPTAIKELLDRAEGKAVAPVIMGSITCDITNKTRQEKEEILARLLNRS